jgi:hypothetical protein
MRKNRIRKKKIEAILIIRDNSALINLCLITIMVILAMSANCPADPGRVDLNFRLESIYDDNILDYSDADLDLIASPDVSPERYGIVSKGDYIINPQLDFTYKTSLAGHTLHLGARFDYYYYKRNDIKRYYRFETYFRRYFDRGFYFEGSVTYIPDYYFRNSYVTGEGYFEAKFDKLSLEAKLAMPLMKRLQGNAYYRYNHKDFIPIFNERDINEHEFVGEFIYHPVRLWKGWGSYTFVHAVAAGADNPDYLRDTSFDAFLFTLGSRFYLKGIHKKSFQIAGRAIYKRVYYQTSKLTPEDEYRLGRKDNRWYLKLMLSHNIIRTLEFGLEYYRKDKEVDLPAVELQQYLESSSNSVYFILNYSL